MLGGGASFPRLLLPPLFWPLPGALMLSGAPPTLGLYRGLRAENDTQIFGTLRARLKRGKQVVTVKYSHFLARSEKGAFAPLPFVTWTEMNNPPI